MRLKRTQQLAAFDEKVFKYQARNPPTLAQPDPRPLDLRAVTDRTNGANGARPALSRRDETECVCHQEPTCVLEQAGEEGGSRVPHHLMIFLSRGGAWLQVDGIELAEVTNNLLEI